MAMVASVRARLLAWSNSALAATQGRSRALVGLVAGTTAAFVGAFALGAMVAAEPAPSGGDVNVPGLLGAASTDLAARIADGGPGIRWTVTQDQVLESTSGKTTLVVNSTSRGAARGTNFVQEIRQATDLSQVRDFDRSAFNFGTVIAGDEVWRNEGDGFFATDRASVPGLGMDPVTLTRLPTLLRRVANARDLGQETLDSVTVRHFSGQVDAIDWPGVVASDALSLTETTIAVDIWIDSGGRLFRLSGLTRNVAWTDGSLWIRSTATFATDVPETLDQPLPRLVGTPQPKP
jgi:hypothetical protein